MIQAYYHLVQGLLICNNSLKYHFDNLLSQIYYTKQYLISTSIQAWNTKMFSKVVNVTTPISYIRDNSVIAISGFNMATTPEYLILELYKSYSRVGSPRNLFIISDALPAVPGRALDNI